MLLRPKLGIRLHSNFYWLFPLFTKYLDKLKWKLWKIRFEVLYFVEKENHLYLNCFPFRMGRHGESIFVYCVSWYLLPRSLKNLWTRESFFHSIIGAPGQQQEKKRKKNGQSLTSATYTHTWTGHMACVKKRRQWEKTTAAVWPVLNWLWPSYGKLTVQKTTLWHRAVIRLIWNFNLRCLLFRRKARDLPQ